MGFPGQLVSTNNQTREEDGEKAALFQIWAESRDL